MLSYNGIKQKRAIDRLIAAIDRIDKEIVMTQCSDEFLNNKPLRDCMKEADMMLLQSEALLRLAEHKCDEYVKSSEIIECD